MQEAADRIQILQDGVEDRYLQIAELEVELQQAEEEKRHLLEHSIAQEHFINRRLEFAMLEKENLDLHKGLIRVRSNLCALEEEHSKLESGVLDDRALFSSLTCLNLNLDLDVGMDIDFKESARAGEGDRVRGGVF